MIHSMNFQILCEEQCPQFWSHRINRDNEECNSNDTCLQLVVFYHEHQVKPFRAEVAFRIHAGS